jgi:bifunctional non-homologous end joining protein LigD
MSDPARPLAEPPGLIPPMLATLGPMPSGPGWALELKWDGVRAVTYVDHGTVRVVSRNNLDVTGHYPELAVLGSLLRGQVTIVDGEVVPLDEVGHASFSRLQDRMHVRAPGPALLAAVPVLYQVFDVLHVDGEPTVDLPYWRRREPLADLGLNGETVRVPPNFVDVDGGSVLAAAEAGGLQGVVAKRWTSSYQPGRRSRDWIKVPLNRTQEVVIVGYKPGGGRRDGTVGSLVLAVPDTTATLAFAGGHHRRRTPPAPGGRRHQRTTRGWPDRVNSHGGRPVAVGQAGATSAAVNHAAMSLAHPHDTVTPAPPCP